MSLYKVYNNKNEIMGIEKEQRVPFCLEMINKSDIKQKMKVTDFTFRQFGEKEKKNRLYKEYESSIMSIEEAQMKKIIQKYDYPIFIKFNKSSFHAGKSIMDNYVYQARIYFYTYKRYGFIKNVNKIKANLEAKKNELVNIPQNIFNYFSIKKINKEILTYENELSYFITNYINSYTSWLKENFNILHLPIDLFEELNQRILLSSNDNLEKTCIVLDEIAEKIELFHNKAKKLKIKNGYQLLIESSVDEFIKYINLKIKTLQDFSILTSYGDNLEGMEEKDIEALEEIKNNIFSEN